MLVNEDENPPTLEEASVKLLSVVLLPAEGLPTRPMRGSRGMVRSLYFVRDLTIERQRGRVPLNLGMQSPVVASLRNYVGVALRCAVFLLRHL